MQMGVEVAAVLTPVTAEQRAGFAAGRCRGLAGGRGERYRRALS